MQLRQSEIVPALLFFLAMLVVLMADPVERDDGYRSVSATPKPALFDRPEPHRY